jgi:hypothetical protein
MGKSSELFIQTRDIERDHMDDAYVSEQWQSRQRESSKKNTINVNDQLSDLFKSFGEIFSK